MSGVRARSSRLWPAHGVIPHPRRTRKTSDVFCRSVGPASAAICFICTYFEPSHPAAVSRNESVLPHRAHPAPTWSSASRTVTV